MTPLQILQDVITIARAIKAQVDTAKNNHEKLKTLYRTVELLVASLQGLPELPNNAHFIQSLTDFQSCIKDTKTLVDKITKMGKMTRFFYAQTIEGDVNDCKQKIVDFIPLLNLGIGAQHLADREKDRRDAVADRQAFVAQKEQALREAHAAAKIEQREREAILLKQFASIRRRLDQPSVAPAAAVSAAPTSPLPDELIVYLDDIVFEQKIEEGDFGSVYQGTWQDQPVTIKCFDHLATESEHRQLIREAQVMSRLHHEAIAHFYGACLDEERPCLLTSIFEKGTLEVALTSLSLAERLGMAKDLARGLVYLHSQSIIHGDIHPKHIGVTQHSEAKWTDFGLAKVRAAGIATLPRVSREAAWQAPESWQNRTELSTASDVYSFGILLWTLVTGKLPYTEMTSSKIIQHVKRGEREAIPSEVPEACRALIEACWQTDAISRPTANQIVRALRSIEAADFRPPSPTGEAYYERGVASERAGNMIEAYENYQRSAAKHYPKSLTSLGLFALQGLGGQAVNKLQAQAYLERAAENGHARAMFNLGRIFEKGDTVTGRVDLDQALRWYERTLKSDPEFPRCREKITTLTTQIQSLRQEAMTKRRVGK